MRRVPDALIPASAVLFGIITWALAHALTYLLFAHIHPGPVPEVHMHGGEWPDVLALIALVATSVLAAIAVRFMVSGGGRRPSARIAGARLSPTAAVYAPAAFVLVEFAQHFAGGDEGPPALLLIVGVVLHAAMGAVTPLLWTGVVRPILAAILIVCCDLEQDVSRRGRATLAEASWARSRHVNPLGSRGPPVRARTFALSSFPV